MVAEFALYANILRNSPASYIFFSSGQSANSARSPFAQTCPTGRVVSVARDADLKAGRLLKLSRGRRSLDTPHQQCRT